MDTSGTFSSCGQHTTRGLIVDHMLPADILGWGVKSTERADGTRKEAEEDIDITDFSVMQSDRFIMRVSNDLEVFGFHGVKLSNM